MPSARACPRRSQKLDAGHRLRSTQKLGNADFVERAPEEVVEEQRERREEAEARKAKMEEALSRLKDAVAVTVIPGRLAEPRPRRSHNRCDRMKALRQFAAPFLYASCWWIPGL